MEQIYKIDLSSILKLNKEITLEETQINNLPLIIINDEEHIHLKALRTKVNSKILITDGFGLTAECLVLSFDKKFHTLKVLKIYYFLNEINKELVLFLGVLDNKDRLEFAIEKSIELGIKKIYLVNTEFSSKIKLNINRLNSKAIAAIKQCKRSILPEIKLIDFEEINKVIEYYNSTNDQDLICVKKENDLKVKNIQAKNTQDKNLIFIADINGVSVKNIMQNFQQNLINSKKIFIFVGAEGGFSDKEVSYLQKIDNNITLKLSENRLRAETACISIISYVVGFI